MNIKTESLVEYFDYEIKRDEAKAPINEQYKQFLQNTAKAVEQDFDAMCAPFAALGFTGFEMQLCPSINRERMKLEYIITAPAPPAYKMLKIGQEQRGRNGNSIRQKPSVEVVNFKAAIEKVKNSQKNLNQAIRAVPNQTNKVLIRAVSLQTNAGVGVNLMLSVEVTIACKLAGTV